MTLFLDHFWISPYSFSSYVALVEKQIEFSVVEVALELKQQRSKEYIETSYTGRVPALRTKTLHLAESSAIAEYLEEAYPHGRPLFPLAMEARAKARMIMAWLRSDFAALRAERSTHTMFYSQVTTDLSPAAQADGAKLIAFCETMLAQPSHLFGDWCLADAELSFMLHRLILNGHDVPHLVRQYAESNWQRDSVQRFVSRARPPYIPY